MLCGKYRGNKIHKNRFIGFPYYLYGYAFDASDELKEELSDSIDSFSESDLVFTVLTFFFVAAFLVFAITSIVYLCKKPANDEVQ